MGEINAVVPDVIVLLGATAAKSLLGSSFRLTAHRSEALQLPTARQPTWTWTLSWATTHPSAVLRGPPEGRETAFESLVTDLKFAAGLFAHAR